MVCFEFVLFQLEIYDENRQKCLISRNPTPLSLGEGVLSYVKVCSLRQPEAPKLPISASPRGRLLLLGVGSRLGEGPLRLSEPAVLFLFPFFC